MSKSAIRNRLLLIGSLIPWLTITVPVYALKFSLGVVKSRENSAQWVQITNRLKATGVDYCTLDANDWQDISALKDVRVLLLPNVSNLNGSQVETLDAWTKKGGKLILTGPTGTLAQPEVFSKLTKIAGASWGFMNTYPATLQIKSSQKTAWNRDVNIYSNFIGGVIVPQNKTETVAVWISEGNPPAVTQSSQAIFLGWRWGEDRVASSSLDTAWLQAALNRYGVSANNSLFVENEGHACTRPVTTLNENRPVVPDVEKDR